MSYSDYTEQDVRRVLNYVNIKVPDQTDSEGNVTINSPLREDNNPSFSINLKKDGTWIDFGTDRTGNLNSLIVDFCNVNADQAFSFIQDILKNNYPRKSVYDLKGNRIEPSSNRKEKKKKTVEVKSDNLNSKLPKNEKKVQVEKAEEQFEFDLEKAKNRLDQEDHSIIKTVQSYDILDKETLQIYDCGIINHHGYDWLSMPYKTGVQLYRRKEGDKVIRMVKGSKPKESWFGLSQLSQKGALIIAKSPREAMLLNQEFGDYIDAVSITSGEIETLSGTQSTILKELITSYKIVKVIFDCDTDQAHQIAKEFTSSVQKVIGRKAVIRYINIHELTESACKDVADLFNEYDSKWILENVLVKGSTLNGKNNIDIQEVVSRENRVEDAPRFPEEVYKILPSEIRGLTDMLDEQFKKDVFLTSALPIMASHMPNVKIAHNDGAYSPDYFSILIANPGSGKGIADKAKKLGQELDAHLILESDKEKAKWEQLPKDERESSPKPKSKRLFMPGNSSSRAVYEALACNEGRGLIFETEIDSLVNASNQEWGDYSDLLRKTFHHESISLSRKEFDLNVPKPELSIFMSGTFDQFRSMFPSAENGYYSRFAFYTFQAPIKWQSHRPSKRSRALDERIERNSKRLFYIYQHLSDREKPLMVYLEERHWDQLDTTFEQNMHQIKEDKLSEYLQSSNKRLAIIAIRIAAVVAVFRIYEQDKSEALKKTEITLTDDDFEIGYKLANTHLNHTLKLYHQIPNVRAGKSTSVRLKQFYKLLADSFQKKEADFVGFHLKITKRSVTNYLKRLLEEGLLTKQQHGAYRKAD